MRTNTKLGLIVVAMIASVSAFAAPSQVESPIKRGGGLPELNCNRTTCDLSGSTSLDDAAIIRPSAPNPNPAVVGPPAAQRFLWLGAGPASCQSLKAIVPAPTISNPYEYIKATTIPVPLGSTHVSLLARAESNISGGPAGSMGVVGLLQIKRSTSVNWTIAASSYIYSLQGTPTPTSLYGAAAFQSLEDLAALPVESGPGGVPDAIDVRFGAFAITSSDGGFTNVNYSSVCRGTLTLSF